MRCQVFANSGVACAGKRKISLLCGRMMIARAWQHLQGVSAHRRYKLEQQSKLQRARINLGR